KDVRVRFLHLDAYRESLGDVHPVELAFHERQTMRDVEFVRRLDGPSHTLHDSAETTPRQRGQIELNVRAGLDVRELSLAKVRHDVPLPRVQQREHRDPGRSERADGDVEVDDTTGKRRDHPAVRELQLRQIHRGDGTRTLRGQSLE